eukprot:TRINITY_DN10115_c0_g2_i1.p3 TRINITY_DN10115_c0_g2~~TRINITY_DN10115_c0_g2_i1.p3  ORF type:complete len:139 (+),score=37.28 TRINITY_DN10115_c0_g2_i1:109-525(+)
MQQMKQASLALAVALYLLGPLGVAGANKRWSTEVDVLHKVPCKKVDRVKRGDKVRIMLATMADNEGIDPVRSQHAVEHDFIVGQYRIPPVDSSVKGMCLGEKRAVHVLWDHMPGMVYEVELVNHTTRRGVVIQPKVDL